MEYFTNDIFKIHKVAHDMDCKTIALTIPPVKMESAEPDITKIRKKINEDIMNGPKNIPEGFYHGIDISALLPMHDISNDVKNIMWQQDGLHLTPEGYDIISVILASFFNKILIK